MSNLENFNNLYANLAESAYNDRPNNFPELSNMRKEQKIDFSKHYVNKKTKLVETKGGTHLPNNGIVYLQPDKTLENKTEYYIDYSDTDFFGNPQAKKKNSQKGLLTDEKAGFNAYFVTDSPTLSQETKQTYLAIRG
ncbi:hypothetical protein GYN17_03500, partial [Lactococcus piscium]|nr:hypothetical protein [Lactococcus paracarnosus]MCJ1983203.1 hypothetical protein [Lactococcus paracarnosus]MCJ1997299.1 hypothetical protein [Lactococcus paracarnosus]